MVLVTDAASGAEREITLLGESDAFGARSLRRDQPRRAASIMACGELKTAFISRHDFEAAIAEPEDDAEVGHVAATAGKALGAHEQALRLRKHGFSTFALAVPLTASGVDTEL